MPLLLSISQHKKLNCQSTRAVFSIKVKYILN